MDIIILWMNVFDVVDVIGVMYVMDAIGVYIYILILAIYKLY